MGENDELDVPENLLHLMQRRNEEWRLHDTSRRHLEQLQALAHRVPAGAPNDPPGRLSRTGSPPDELEAALKSLQEEVKEIERLQSALETARQQRSKTIWILIGLGIGAVLLLCLVFGIALTGRR